MTIPDPSALLPVLVTLAKSDGLYTANLTQVCVLFACQDKSPTPGDLAQLLSCPSPRITRAVDNLTHAKLVRRQKNPAKYNEHYILTTDRGRALVARALATEPY